MSTLKEKTVSGIFWSLLQNIGAKGITFIVTIMLARLLTPEIFGLIGMLMIFIQVSQFLVQAGFNQALIQKKEVDEVDYYSVFWINLVIGIILYGILYISAPWIAAFYEQPILVDLTRVFALVFVINAFSYVQEARLIKQLKFKTLTIIHIPSTIIGGMVSLAMAFLGYGVWSLIAIQLITRLAYAVQIWFYSKWKPLFVFNTAKAKKLFTFGGNLMLAGIIGTVFNNIYVVIIAKFFPINMAGYYQNANNLVQQPTRILSSSLNKVTFSSFSTIQNDNTKLKSGYKKVVQQMLFWVCPIFIFAGILAEPLFNVVFGEKWLSAVTYFQILCVFGIMYPLNVFNLNIINVKGRSDLYLKLTILKRLITVIGIIISIPFGIWYLLLFQAANTIIEYFINSFFSGKFIGYTMREQLFDIFPFIVSGIGVGIMVWIIDQRLTPAPDILRIVFGLITGWAGYLFIAWLKKFEPFLDFVKIVKSKEAIFRTK